MSLLSAMLTLCTREVGAALLLPPQHSTETKANSSQNASVFELSDERRNLFLKLLAAQTTPRDRIRIGCTSNISCIAAERFLLLFREAGWQIEGNKVFRLEWQLGITGVAIVTYPPADGAGRWHLIDESHRTIYYAFRSIDVPTCGSRDNSLRQGTLGIYFGTDNPYKLEY
jgi:hypothetical protein